MAAGPLDCIPGLREAEDHYRQENAEAFAGVEPRIGKMVEVLPFTPQMFVELDGADSPFFRNGAIITEADVAVFLWRVSPYYVRGNEDQRRFFVANLAVLPYDTAVDEITEYLRRSLAGMPLWPGKIRTEVTLVQWPARLVHMFASEYGWAEEYVLNLPFRRLWQYANRILEEKNPDFTEKSAAGMRARDKWLNERNAAARGAA